MQISASWKTGKGKTRFDRRYQNLFWARNPMDASEWPHLFENRPKRPIYNFLDESQKSRRAKRARGPREKPFLEAAGGNFKRNKNQFRFEFKLPSLAS